MSNVRRLIEHLDVNENHHKFAQDAEQFGDDLEQAWANIENGADLLWLAASVGVEPKKIVATARELLAGVFEQTETAGRETAQVLEAVHAWEKGEWSADKVDRSGWYAYSLIAQMDPNKQLPPDATEVADAAVWLTTLVRDIPSHGLPDPLEDDDGDMDWGASAWMMLHCLAFALAYHQNFDDSSSDKHQQAYEDAMRRFAITIREHISGAEVQAAARQKAVWPL